MSTTSRQSKTRGRKINAEPGGELASNRSLLLLFGVVIAALFVFSYLNRINDLIAVRSEVAALEADLAGAQQRNAELEATQREVASAAYVGETARSELGLIQPGDDAFVILGQDLPDINAENGLAATAASAPSKPSGGNVFDIDWWRALIGLQ